MTVVLLARFSNSVCWWFGLCGLCVDGGGRRFQGTALDSSPFPSCKFLDLGLGAHLDCKSLLSLCINRLSWWMSWALGPHLRKGPTGLDLGHLELRVEQQEALWSTPGGF